MTNRPQQNTVEEALAFFEDLGTWIWGEEDAKQLQGHLDTLRTALDTCICWDGDHHNFEGSRLDCAVHGAVRAFNSTVAELLDVKVALSILKGKVGRVAYFIHAASLKPDVSAEDADRYTDWVNRLRGVTDHD